MNGDACAAGLGSGFLRRERGFFYSSILGNKLKGLAHFSQKLLWSDSKLPHPFTIVP